MTEDVRTKFRFPHYRNRIKDEDVLQVFADLEYELNRFFHGDFYIEAGLIVKDNITVIETPGGITGLTASRALETDADGDLVVSVITSTELGYLDGVTSNIQDQINAISFLSDIIEDTTPQLGGDLDVNSHYITGYTASRGLITDGSGNIVVSDVTSTEIGYLDGVTSNIQDQIDAIGGGLENVVEDTSPELGGELDLLTYWIYDSDAKLRINLLADGLLIKALTDNASSYVGWEVQPDENSAAIKCELFVPANPTSTAHCLLKYTPDDSDSEFRIEHGLDGAIKLGSSGSYLSFFGKTTAVVQATHIADPSGGGTIDAEARTAINSILTVLENLGFVASS